MISIIIPTYFEEKYIGNCLRSIKKNSFKDIEIIVVDSNSLDRTREIAKKYADRVINIKSRGVGKARNLGAKIAKGDVLVFVDADTTLSKNFLGEFEDIFKNKEIVYSSGYLKGKNENMSFFLNIYQYFWFGGVNIMSSICSFFGCPLFTTVYGFRKWVFEKVGGFDEKLAIAEDLDVALKVKRFGKYYLNKKCLSFTSTRRIKKYGAIKNFFMFLSGYFRVFILKKKPWIEDFPHVDL